MKSRKGQVGRYFSGWKKKSKSQTDYECQQQYRQQKDLLWMLNLGEKATTGIQYINYYDRSVTRVSKKFGLERKHTFVY